MATGRIRKTLFASAGAVAAALALAPANQAEAYIGESFLEIPGLSGGWRGSSWRGWARIEAHYWKSEELGMFGGNRFGSTGQRTNFRRSKLVYSGPSAPEAGPSSLVLSIDKRSPAVAPLLARCRDKAVIPSARYTENSWLARGLRELGPRPASMPAWFEYRLGDVRIAACPQVAEAPEQAFVVTFERIEWTNYTGTAMGVDNPLPPAALRPIQSSGLTRTWVIDWFAVAHDVADNQCTAVNAKPPEDEYYRLMDPQAAARERAERAKSGGVHYENSEMELRGPMKLNAALLPGIVRDPGIAIPQIRFARGLDLDGDDGRGAPPRGICRHSNYVSADGLRKGIDNQLFTIQGCMPGHRGHKGFLMQYRNEQRRNGLISMMIQVSGIDNERNDDSVDVAVLYSKDPMAKSASGQTILADYTYSLTDHREYAYYFTVLDGRIRNGVIETAPVDLFRMNPGIDTELNLHQARMRLEVMPDGKLKGVVAGYEDWRRIMQQNANSNSEFHYGYQAPGMYNAFLRYADGMKDPVTGQCTGISTAHDIEGVPAFIPPKQYLALTGQAGSDVRKNR